MEPSSNRSFAELLRRARHAAGVTQEQLAASAGISTRTVSDLERGIIRAPQEETLRLLADALNLPIEDRRTWIATRRQLARRAGQAARGLVPTPPRSSAVLPQPLTSFIGRAREVGEVVELLRRPNTRLIVLTGMGGVGKTRLALAVGQAVEEFYPDGVWFVDLAPVRDPQLVLGLIATTLGIPASDRQTALAALTTTLRNSHRLLLLDNVEQVASASPGFADLLVRCPSLDLLATSRAPLRVRGEREYEVLPFPTPDETTVFDLDHLRRSPAVDLFEQRARDISSHFQITAQNAPAVAEVCRRVDGLPLAIELVAARIRLLPPAALVARLERRLPLLTAASQDVPVRQQTLRNTISWSYELLEPDQQRLFRALGVFHGGWALEAVEAVASGTPQKADSFQVLSGLETLVAHHLVQMRVQADGEPRYSMLETITEFTREMLDAGAETQALSRQHADFYVTFAEQVAPHLESSDQARWIVLLETEYPNLRAVMRWANEQAELGDLTAAVTSFRMASALWWFWHVHNHMPEGRAQLVTLMGLLRAKRTSLQASMSPEEWSSIYARALFLLGVYSTWPVSYYDEQGWSLLTESLELYRELNQQENIASTLLFLGYGAQRIGNFTDAADLLAEGLAIFRQLGDRRGAALVLQGLGTVALRTGDFEQGSRWLTESLAEFTQLSDVRSIAASRAALGAVRLRQGDLAQAYELISESLHSRFEIGDKGGIAWCLEWMAETALANPSAPKGPFHAACFLGAASALRIALASPIDPVDQSEYARLVASVQAELSDPAFVAAWEAGRTMALEDVVALALVSDRVTTA